MGESIEGKTECVKQNRRIFFGIFKCEYSHYLSLLRPAFIVLFTAANPATRGMILPEILGLSFVETRVSFALAGC